MHPADLVYAIDKGRLLFTANVPGGVFPKGMLRDAKQNPELASAKMQFIAFCTLKGRTVHSAPYRPGRLGISMPSA